MTVRGIIFLLCLLGTAGTLLMSCWQDFKEQEICDIYTGGFCVCCAVLRFLQGGPLLAFVMVCACLIMLSVQDLPWIGGADLAIIFGLVALFGAPVTPIIMFWFSALAIVAHILERKVFHSTLFVKASGRITLVPIMAISILPIQLTLSFMGTGYGW